MGGSESTMLDADLYSAQDFTEVEQCHDSRYGAITKLLDNRTQQLVCELKQKNINTQADFDSKVQHLRGRKELNHYSLVKFINFTADKSEEFCSTHWSISQLYEYVNKDLSEQIEVRRASNLRFTEGELWYLLQTTVEGLTYLKVQDIIHGDIRPSQVLLTDAGKVKLGEQFQHQQSLSGYQQILMDQRRTEIVLSPQVYETLQDRHVAVQFDVASNDVFSLGMTILEAAVLRDSDECYNTENVTFIQERLRDRLSELQNLYSPRFYDVVSRMLIESDYDRPTMEDIHKELDQLTADELFRREIAQELTLYEIQREDEQQQEEVVEQQQQVEYVEQQVEEQVVIPQQQQPAPQQAIPQQQQVQPTVSGYDLKDIDDRINLVLAKSRETVEQYGGQKAFDAYKSYENSKGFEPVRRSQLDNVNYTSQIYNSSQQIINNSAQKTQQQPQQQLYQQTQPTTTSFAQKVEKAAEQEVQKSVTTTYQAPSVQQTVSAVQNSYQAPSVQQTVSAVQNSYQAPVSTTQTQAYKPQTTTTTQNVASTYQAPAQQQSVTTTYQAPTQQQSVTTTYQAPAQQQSVTTTYQAPAQQQQSTSSSTYQKPAQSTTATYQQPAQTTTTNTYQQQPAQSTTTTTYQAAANLVGTVNQTYQQPNQSTTTTTYQPAANLTNTYQAQAPSTYSASTTFQQQPGQSQQQPPITSEELDQQIKKSLARNQQIQDTMRSTQQQIQQSYQQ